MGKNINNKMIVDSTFANIFITLRIETFTLYMQLTHKSNNFSI